MFTVIKGFSGLVSGSKGQIITLKDKTIIKSLISAGYIEEYNPKNQNASELKKENDSLKKTIETLENQISDLNIKLEEANQKMLDIESKSLDPGTEETEKENK